MNARRMPYRRIWLPAALALVLAAESIAVVAAVDSRIAAGPVAASVTTAFTAQASRPTSAPLVNRHVAESARGNLRERLHDSAQTRPTVVTETRSVAVPAPVRPSTAAINKAKTVSKSSTATSATGSTASAKSTSYSGRNRMWFPALGINRSVSYFACTSTAYPGNVVYRWGCAGKNNVYLFGHAHSVFKPLHDAYVRGRLKKGMKVTYADGNGKVRTYKIAWWKVTTPDNGAFAFAAQSRPSMTLQTCVGANSQYRLIVRLVAV